MGKRIVVIGGGPAGMMAAYSAKLHHPEAAVTLLERNHLLGSKMKLTGGGRCNLTARTDRETIIKNTPGNGRFLFSSLDQMDAYQLIDFFSAHGCPLVEEDHHRMFPATMNAQDPINCLEQLLRECGVELRFAQKVISFSMENNHIETENEHFAFDALIIATGGKSFPLTGSDGSMFSLLEKNGHTIIPCKPAETPLVSNSPLIQSKDLQGLSFQDIPITVYDSKKKTTIVHDVLITHFGLSGPGALRASYYVGEAIEREKTVDVGLNFAPQYSFSVLEEKLSLMTLQQFGKQENLPKRLIDWIARQPEASWPSLLHDLRIEVYDLRGFNVAFVTKGGVNIKEVYPRTMKSKIHPALSICGECLDVNSYTGGYNLTIAMSTGFTAGKHVLED